jgi:hypothetical protein
MKRYRIDIKEVGSGWSVFGYESTTFKARHTTKLGIIFNPPLTHFRITDTLNNTIIYDTTRG